VEDDLVQRRQAARKLNASGVGAGSASAGGRPPSAARVMPAGSNTESGANVKDDDDITKLAAEKLILKLADGSE
jgi:hypothetical protein